MNALTDLIQMSCQAGVRPDWVQAGGGNTSVQLEDGSFWVKASGCRLGEVADENDFVLLKREAVADILRVPEVANPRGRNQQDAAARELLETAILKGTRRPSIEVYMHALLDRWTLHTHPLGVNILACQRDGEALLLERYPEALYVPYATPGIRLALMIQTGLQTYVREYGGLPRVLFLQNHGLIVTAPNLEELTRAREAVDQVTRLEFQGAIPMMPAPEPEEVLDISSMDGRPLKGYQIHCPVIRETRERQPGLFFQRPFSPDGVTFCGLRAIEIQTFADLADSSEARDYHAEFGVVPKVACEGGDVFVMAADDRKARDIQDVLRFQLVVMSAAGEKYQPLDDDELRYLTHWEAEQYRQNL